MSKRSAYLHQAPVRFETDKRAFGVVHFPRAKGQTRVSLPDLRGALASSLRVHVEMKKKGWFGPKVPVFTFMGARITVKILENGNAALDLGHIDDEVRETILEHIRTSLEFDGL